MRVRDRSSRCGARTPPCTPPPCTAADPMLTPASLTAQAPHSPVARGNSGHFSVWARFVETSGGIVAGLSGRYATALFDLAQGDKAVDAVAASLAAVKAGLAESPDLRTLTTTPMIDRATATRTIEAVAGAMKLDPLTTKFLGVLAHNRRLSALPAIIRDFTKLSARSRGEITAEVTSAHPLDDAQQAALKAKLRAGLGADAALVLTVDPAIMGGLIVRVGSRMVDSSLRTKLNSLATAMKG